MVIKVSDLPALSEVHVAQIMGSMRKYLLIARQMENAAKEDSDEV